MLLRKQLNPSTVMRLGLVVLIIANVSHWLLQRNGRSGTDATDAIEGLLFGTAIGCLLLSIYMNRRRSPGK